MTGKRHRSPDKDRNWRPPLEPEVCGLSLILHNLAPYFCAADAECQMYSDLSLFRLKSSNDRSGLEVPGRPLSTPGRTNEHRLGLKLGCHKLRQLAMPEV